MKHMTLSLFWNVVLLLQVNLRNKVVKRSLLDYWSNMNSHVNL